jgi:hypothetical protein
MNAFHEENRKAPLIKFIKSFIHSHWKERSLYTQQGQQAIQIYALGKIDFFFQERGSTR